MKIKAFPIFIFIISALSVIGQDDLIDFETFDAIEPVNPKGKAVLIVPFSSDMFNNQESEYIVNGSGMVYEQTINYFKTYLDSSIFNALDDSCKVISMLNSFAVETSSDLERLYGAAHYYLAEKNLIDNKDKYSMYTKLNKNSNNVTEREANFQNGDIASVRKDTKNTYIGVKFNDEVLINTIAMKYSAKYLLFINQFDIMGDYSDPYKISQKTYDRIIKVHYSLFSSSGEFINGNVIEYRFPAYEDNITTICSTNFPEIAKILARQIPH